MSDGIVRAAGVATDGLEHCLLDLKGKAEQFPAWIERVPAGVGGADTRNGAAG